MEPIANETWKSFQRSYYRARLLLLLASLGEAYVGQLSRMLRIPHSRVVALLEGNPAMGYSIELSLLELGLAQRKLTLARGRAYEVTTKGLRKARSMSASAARRAGSSASLAHEKATPGRVARAAQNPMTTWSVSVTGERSGDVWALDG